MGRFALPEAQRPQRFRRKEGNLAYSSGVTSNLQVGQTDYLTALDLIGGLTLGIGGTSASAISGAGAFGPLGNVQVRVNGGRTPYSLPGYHANQFLKIWNHDYVDNLTSTVEVTGSTNTWKSHLRIPLTVDPISELGAWFTGDTQLNLNVSLTWNAVSVVFASVSGNTLGGSLDIYSEKFAAPPPDMPGGYPWNPTPAQPGAGSGGSWLNNISFYHQTELYGTFALSNGTTNINLETDQDFVRIVLIFYTGSLNASSFAPADGLFTSMSLKLNDVALIYDTVAEDQWRFEYLNTYKLTNTPGTEVIDFMRLEPPTRRDILPADADKIKRMQLQIVSTSANNNVDVITETMVDSQFALRWAASAKRRAGN